MNSLVELFSDVDDFCQAFLPSWENQQLASGLRQQRRRGQLCLNEIMAIIIFSISRTTAPSKLGSPTACVTRRWVRQDETDLTENV